MALSKNEKSVFWLNHINQWRASGLSQAKYCLKENISHHSFSWWRSKRFKNTLKKNSVSFVPAVVSKAENIAINLQGDIHLIFPNQTKLMLPATLGLDNLISIVKSLGGLS